MSPLILSALNSLICRRGEVFILLGTLGVIGDSAYGQSLPILSGQPQVSHVVSPATLRQRRWRVSGTATYTDHHRGDPRGETGHIGLSVVRNVAKGLDGSVFLAYAAVQTGVEDLRGIGLSAKWLLAGRPATFRVGWWGVVLAPIPSRQELISSEEVNYLAELLFSYAMPKGEWIANLGAGKTDVYSMDRDELRAELTLTARLGYWMRLGAVLGLTAELIGSSFVAKHDEDLFFQVGMGWFIAPALQVRVSGGFGLPSRDRANTNVRAVVGIDFYGH